MSHLLQLGNGCSRFGKNSLRVMIMIHFRGMNDRPVRISDDSGSYVGPVECDIQQTDASFTRSEEIDFVAVGSKPTERCQSCHHWESKLREKLPGESHGRYYVEHLDHTALTITTDAKRVKQMLGATVLTFILFLARAECNSEVPCMLRYSVTCCSDGGKMNSGSSIRILRTVLLISEQFKVRTQGSQVQTHGSKCKSQ